MLRLCLLERCQYTYARTRPVKALSHLFKVHFLSHFKVTCLWEAKSKNAHRCCGLVSGVRVSAEWEREFMYASCTFTPVCVVSWHCSLRLLVSPCSSYDSAMVGVFSHSNSLQCLCAYNGLHWPMHTHTHRHQQFLLFSEMQMTILEEVFSRID